jgi:hypothetical protein
VAGEGKLGYSFFREHENFFLKGRNDIVVWCFKCWWWVGLPRHWACKCQGTGHGQRSWDPPKAVIACGDPCWSGLCVAPDPRLGKPFPEWCGCDNVASPADIGRSVVVRRHY